MAGTIDLFEFRELFGSDNHYVQFLERFRAACVGADMLTLVGGGDTIGFVLSPDNLAEYVLEKLRPYLAADRDVLLQTLDVLQRAQSKKP